MEPACAPRQDGRAEQLLGELEALVKDVVRASSWWERRGVDCAILVLSLLALPAGEGHGTQNTAEPIADAGGTRGVEAMRTVLPAGGERDAGS